MVPPAASTRPRQTARPRPVPLPTSFVVTNGSKRRSRISRRDAGPVVLDLDAHAVARRARRAHAMRPPSRGTASAALRSRFEQHLHDALVGERDARQIGATSIASSTSRKRLLRPHQRERRRRSRVATEPGPRLPRSSRRPTRAARSRAGRAGRGGCARSRASCARGSRALLAGSSPPCEEQLLEARGSPRSGCRSRARAPRRGGRPRRGARIARAAPARSLEIRGVALDLGDLGAQRLLVGAQPLGHLREARAQLDELARAARGTSSLRAPSATRRAARESARSAARRGASSRCTRRRGARARRRPCRARRGARAARWA